MVECLKMLSYGAEGPVFKTWLGCMLNGKALCQPSNKWIHFSIIMQQKETDRLCL